MLTSKLHIALFSLLFLSIGPSAFSQLHIFQEAFEQKKIDEAIHAFDKAWSIDSNEAKPFIVKYLSLYAMKGDYRTAFSRLQPLITNNTLPTYLKDKA